MAYTQKGYDAGEGTGTSKSQNDKNKARLAFLKKNINNTGISEKKYQSMKSEIKSLEEAL